MTNFLPKDDLVAHDVAQGSDAWLALRGRYRTGSDTAAVMGISPYKSRDEFLSERITGKRAPVSEFVNKAREYGTATEVHARAAYCAETGLFPVPGVYTRGRYIASMDGVVLGNGVARGIEIKSPYRGSKSSRWAAATSGEILPHDRAQLAVQYAVIQCPIDFVVFVPGERLAVIEYTGPSEKEWADIERAWDEFEKDVAAGKLPKSDNERSDFEWYVAADAYVAALMAHERAKADLEAARAKLVALANGSARGAGVSVSTFKRKGAVDWKAAFNAVAPEGFDLGPFTGRELEVVRVSVVGSREQ